MRKTHNSTGNIEDIIRRLTLKQLEALLTFIPSGERTGGYLSVEKAFGSIHTAENNKEKAVGGIISSLAKIKTNEGRLILPAGRDEKGLRWILNEKVLTREQLKEILLQIPGLEA